VPDAQFEDPRLAPLYDVFDDDRSDLDVYVSIATELGAARVLDVGCGTGTFALLLAARGFDVVGVDPAEASLDVARRKPGADAVRWIHGDATSLPPLGGIDLATMTGNVAQAIVDPRIWNDTLGRVRDELRAGGRLVFETRDPAFRAWEEWTPERTRRRLGDCERWTEVTAVRWPLVTFRTLFVFDDGRQLASDSTLRFRSQAEVEADLASHGYVVDEVRGAPDRPGRELVFFARRAA
jgi:SAM-dependent methyltransferase